LIIHQLKKKRTIVRSHEPGYEASDREARRSRNPTRRRSIESPEDQDLYKQ
jgi:hypothetical protein